MQKGIGVVGFVIGVIALVIFAFGAKFLGDIFGHVYPLYSQPESHLLLYIFIPFFGLYLLYSIFVVGK